MLNLGQSFQKVNNYYYATGLLLTPFTKTISAISKKLTIPYHTLHKHLDKPSEKIEAIKVIFEMYIQKLFQGRRVLVIIDDTTIAKIYAEKQLLHVFNIFKAYQIHNQHPSFNY